MPFCAKCGTEISDETRFCPNCGASTAAETAESTLEQPPVTTVSSSLMNRMIRAAKLDPRLYEEVERDQTATVQSLLVVVLASISSGIGYGISDLLQRGQVGWIGVSLFTGILVALLSWFAWSLITYFIGTRVFRGNATFGELLRCLGFSDSPGVLNFLGGIPFIGGVIAFGISVWGLVAMVIAIRQALDFTTGKAILTCIVGWIASVILSVAIGLVFLPFL